MASYGVTQTTIVKVQKRVRELKLSWPLDEVMTEIELQKIMFSKENTASPNKPMPDHAYIHNKLLHNGINKNFCGQNNRGLLCEH